MCLLRRTAHRPGIPNKSSYSITHRTCFYSIVNPSIQLLARLDGAYSFPLFNLLVDLRAVSVVLRLLIDEARFHVVGQIDGQMLPLSQDDSPKSGSQAYVSDYGWPHGS